MKLFILFGQTATGKTAKALELCDSENGEIVNFDSRQIYKKLDIVTGKDRPSDPHYKIWLYDIVDPKESFSSGDYVSHALAVLKDIIARGKTPILVGGTGYYLYHLLYGVPQIAVPENWPLRHQLSVKSISELTSILQEKNPKFLTDLNESDRQNPRRLIRRIEIAYAGGSLAEKPTAITLLANLGPTCRQAGVCNGPTIQYLPFFHTDSEKTREIIRARIMSRIENGAIEETQNLLREGYKQSDPGLNAIGYQQIISYINNEATREQMIELWLTREIQYAKRQKTYFQKYFPNSLIS